MSEVQPIYTFSLTTDLILGEPQTFKMAQWVRRGLRVTEVVANAPVDGFVTLEEVRADNAYLIYDEKREGNLDAWELRVGSETPYPLCTVSDTVLDHGADVVGAYTGKVPDGYPPGFKFTFCVSLRGTPL
jgi:hypothetical protein